MKIYVVMIEDRHIDVDVELFFSKEKALEKAEEIVKECSRHYEDITEEDRELDNDMIKEGWIYYCCYSCEGDCVRVMEKEVGE